MIVDEETWIPRIPSTEVAARWDSAVPVDGPAQAADAGDEPFGALTSIGATQCETLGVALRESVLEHAPHLWPTKAEHLQVRATNLRRAQQSAQNVVLGLLASTETGTATGSASGARAAESFSTELLTGLSIAVEELDLSETLIPMPFACPVLLERMLELKQATSDSVSVHFPLIDRIATVSCCYWLTTPHTHSSVHGALRASRSFPFGGRHPKWAW